MLVAIEMYFPRTEIINVCGPVEYLGTVMLDVQFKLWCSANKTSSLQYRSFSDLIG
jgi:hypothetical protein